jgi:hypothetical protein
VGVLFQHEDDPMSFLQIAYLLIAAAYIITAVAMFTAH